MNVVFVDAQAMHREHPDTFGVPSAEDLAAIQPEWIVKVCADGERFWVRVGMADGEKIGGMVANRLVVTHLHGLKHDDIIHFEKRHVYAVMPPEAML